MEILEQFGFEPVLFIAQIVNFLILFLIFKKFLYQPILKILNDREKKITEGIKDAEKAHLAKEAAEAERDKIIKQASQEAQDILSETKKSADELKSTILTESRNEADKIVANARKQADLEMEKMKKEAAGISLEMSKKILDSVIKGIFTKTEKETILKRGIDQIKKHE